MKKTLLIIILSLTITIGIFADYPDGLGIGVKDSWGSTWVYGGGNGRGLGLSLKTPDLPFFCSIRLVIQKSYFSLAVSGDYYLYHNPLVPDINLHWYLGFGAEVGIGTEENKFSFGTGIRFIVGLSWQVEFTSFPKLELFLHLIPRLGVQFSPSFLFPYGGYGFDLGVRIWLDV